MTHRTMSGRSTTELHLAPTSSRMFNNKTHFMCLYLEHQSINKVNRLLLAVCVCFYAYIYFRFKHAVLGTRISYMGCLTREMNLVVVARQ